jgi:SNF2 family DNA or RNA helicase
MPRHRCKSIFAGNGLYAVLFSYTPFPLTKSRQVLESLLREWRKDPTNKTLIFTKSVKLLGVLEFYLKNRRTYACEYVDDCFDLIFP